MPLLPALFAAILSTFVAATATATAATDSCEALRAEIEGRIRDAGVSAFSVTTLDAGADAPGDVVGSCALGSRKIVYLKDSKAASSAPATAGAAASAAVEPPSLSRPGSAAILTECKPGFVAIRGECKKL